MRNLLWLPLTALLLASAVSAQRTPARSPALILSEFGASNSGLLLDEDGATSDWIELHNRRNAPLDAGGWTLTDDAGDPGKWRIPDGTLIPARGYLVLFASGKDRNLAGAQLHTNFKLSAKGEYLALVRPDGTPTTAYAPAFPIQYSDASFGLAFDPQPSDRLTYFRSPTPGAANTVGGPLVFDLTHSPAQPTEHDKILVTALVPNHLAGGTVELLWRINFRVEKLKVMRDDGKFADVTAGDGIYSVTIPATATDPGEMVRWRVRATHGANGGSTTMPLFPDPLRSPEYLGTVIQDPSVQSALPIWDWHVQFPKKAGSFNGTQTSVYYAGEFYDNVHVRNRGTKWFKRHYKFDFNKDHRLLFTPDGLRRDEANLNSTWVDKAFVRQVLCFDLYRMAGVPGCDAFPIRMQRGGQFFSVAVFIEEPGEEGFLEYHGLDPAGALYKMFNPANSAQSGVEKKTRLHEGNEDLQQLIQGIKQTDDELRRFLFDHVDVAACISYVAATTLMHDNDHIAKNYYLYRDSDGDGEWRFVPWDKDLTLGRNFTPAGGVLNDTIWSDLDPFSHPLFGDKQHPKVDGPHNRLIHALHVVPEIQEMYLRRLRTLMDAYLQPPGTPRAERWLEGRMDQLAIQMDPDVTLDQAKWGIPNWGASYDFHADLDRLEMLYAEVRRVHLYVTHGPPNGLIPGPQANPGIRIGVLEGDPASGDQDEEYIELLNPETVAADLSGWTITGGIELTCPPGTVLAAGGALYASPSLPAFRARAQSPTGGEGRFVVGPFKGHLKSGEWVRLFDAAGQLVDERQY